MSVVVVGSAPIAWVIGAALLVRLLHVRAWRIESADLAISEQVYRLHRLVVGGVAVTSAYAVFGLAAFAYTAVSIDDATDNHWLGVAVAAAGVVVSAIPMIASVR